MQNKIVAKAVVLNADGHVLLLRRSKTDTHRAGHWDFPGGANEPSEDLIAGVAREVYEETGLTIQQSGLTLVYAATEPWAPSNESVTRLLFVARCPSESRVTLSFEHDDYKWVDVAQALADFPHPFYGVGLKYAAEHGLLVS